MNYKRIYNELVERGRNRKYDGMTELHHIVPKCMGGKDKLDNLVELTPREHFLAHWLLYRIYPNHSGIAFAFSSMKMNKYGHRYTPSSRTIGEMREAYISARTGTPHSEETKRKISESLSKSMKGRTSPWKGKTMPDTMTQKMSEVKLGWNRPDEHSKAISEGKKQWYKENDHPNKGKSLQGNYDYDRNSLEDRRLQVKALYDSGMPISTIPKHIQVSRQAIYNWIKEYGWSR